ncbi:hypothetical protein, partial [Daejeonella sp.]|uniref:hypothetical protein n=1 Tax=Daejeonella sp. TaxID=2805397 RepID=UPI0030C21E45
FYSSLTLFFVNLCQDKSNVKFSQLLVEVIWVDFFSAIFAKHSALSAPACRRQVKSASCSSFQI